MNTSTSSFPVRFRSAVPGMVEKHHDRPQQKTQNTLLHYAGVRVDAVRPRTAHNVGSSYSPAPTFSFTPAPDFPPSPAAQQPPLPHPNVTVIGTAHHSRASSLPSSRPPPAACVVGGAEAGAGPESRGDAIVTTTLAADCLPASAGDIFSPRPPFHDAVPRQTILKALASVARKNKPEALSLSSMLAVGGGGADADARRGSASSQQLADALAELSVGKENTPTSAFTTLGSPCFYHERLDDAVNVESILDGVKHDDMSHSRLVQTATSVRQISKQLQRRPIRLAVRNVMIVTKARDNQLVYVTRELALWLLRTPRYGSALGVNVFVDAKLRGSRRFDAAGILAENPAFGTMLRYWTPDLCWGRPEKFDLVLTLGGDGTVLFTSWLFQRIVPPVLPFALGSLGFLTSFEFDRYRDHLDRVMGREGMRVGLRMRFTCTVFRNSTTGGEPEEAEQFEVLNELVIDRGPSPYVSNLELFGDDELLTVIQADGCIFSTPTGSTAYSLSAGGSLVHPEIPCILLTPICPHTLSFRPMVLSDAMALRVAIPRNSRATAYCAFDGKGRVELRQGDHVTITASQYPFPTVTRNDTEWYDSVSRTLRWNTRAATQKAFDASVVAGPVENEIVEGMPEWDIDFDADSACYASEEGSITSTSPLRKVNLLGM